MASRAMRTFCGIDRPWRGHRQTSLPPTGCPFAARDHSALDRQGTVVSRQLAQGKVEFLSPPAVQGWGRGPTHQFFASLSLARAANGVVVAPSAAGGANA